MKIYRVGLRRKFLYLIDIPAAGLINNKLAKLKCCGWALINSHFCSQESRFSYVLLKIKS